MTTWGEKKQSILSFKINSIKLDKWMALIENFQRDVIDPVLKCYFSSAFVVAFRRTRTSCHVSEEMHT